MQLAFEIYGDPKGQPRPRAFARKMGARYVAGVYDSDVADEWKRDVDNAIANAMWRPFLGPLKVRIAFLLRRPKSHKNAKGALKESAPTFHVAKPDLDNLAKLVLDRITKAGVWEDDSCVTELILSKQYTATGQPGCTVWVDSVV